MESAMIVMLLIIQHYHAGLIQHNFGLDKQFFVEGTMVTVIETFGLLMIGALPRMCEAAPMDSSYSDSLSLNPALEAAEKHQLTSGTFLLISSWPIR